MSTRGCAQRQRGDPDATAVALDVLITQPAAPGVPAATAKAIANLVALQDAGGGFPQHGRHAQRQQLRAGRPGAAHRRAHHRADKAAAFVASLQVTAPVATTAADAAPAPAAAPTAADLGAFAFSVADHTAAEAAGIAAAARDKFHRATAQGVLAFGIDPFGVVAAPPPPPAPTTTTTVAVTTADPGATTTTTAAAASTTSTVAGAAAAPTTTTVAKAAGHLPVTGNDVLDVALAAMALFAVGEIARRAAREQADRSRPRASSCRRRDRAASFPHR